MKSVKFARIELLLIQNESPHRVLDFLLFLNFWEKMKKMMKSVKFARSGLILIQNESPHRVLDSCFFFPCFPNYKKGKWTFVFFIKCMFSHSPSPQAPRDPSPEQDHVLAVPTVVLTALYDQMPPQLCPCEISNFGVFQKPPFPTSFALLDITMGQMGNTIYRLLLF